MKNKKTLLLAGLVLSLVLSACNKGTTVTKETFPSVETSTNTQTIQQRDTKAVYYMTSGKMMMVRDGKISSMDSDQTLENGTIVKTNGEVIRKDGSKMMLKNGQSIAQNGEVIVESKFK